MNPRTSFSLLALALAAALAGCATAPAASGDSHRPGGSDQRVQPGQGRAADALYDQYWEENAQAQPDAGDLPGRPALQRPAAGLRLGRVPRADARLHHALAEDGRGDRPATASHGQDLLSYEIFVRDAKNSLEAEQFPDWMLPVNQFGSIASFAVQLGSGTGAQPFKTVKDYDNWLARGARAAGAVRHRHRQHARRHEGRRGAAARADGEGDPAARRADQGQARGHAVLGPDRAACRRTSPTPTRQRLTAAYRDDDRRAADAGLPQAARLHRRRVPAGDARHRRRWTRCPTARPGTRSTRAAAPPPT